jgi:UDP-N-acetyl-D-glucosamine dehydrogenase
MKIAIVGLGYVGLPLSIQFARSGVTVLGLDVDAEKVELLNKGHSYIKHIDSAAIAEMTKADLFHASTDFSRIRDVEAVIICVPTPLNKNREPDISFVIKTGQMIAPYLQPGMLVVLESTTYPGTTEEDLRGVLEENAPVVGNADMLKAEKLKRESSINSESFREQAFQQSTSDSPPRRMRAGVDFHLAFSPEREDPANEQSKVKLIPKIVGGYTRACLERAMALYGKAIDTPVAVSSCRVAEATKLLENIFRSVNIALVNELKLVYGAMGIDIWEVIEAAKTKPFGFMPFYPGPGLGGHCIPIDPFYLTWKAREYGRHTRFIELAGEINTAMPEHVVHRVADALNDRNKAVKGSRILILGLAYKPNVDDERESPSYVLMDLLSERGAQVEYHDPYVPVIRPTREHSHWAGKKSVKWNRATIESFDLVLIATNHSCVNYQELADWAKRIVDTRNAMATAQVAPGKVWKA